MQRIILLSLMLLFPFGLRAQTYEDNKAKKVIEAYFEAVGGKDNWKNICSRVDTAKYSNLERMSQKVSETNPFVDRKDLTISIYQKGMYYRETNKKSGISYSGYNGIEYWMQTDYGSLITFPLNQSDFMKEGLTLVRGYPHRIMESKSISYLKKEKINDDFYDVILVNYYSIERSVFYFNTKTHLLSYSHLKTHENMITEYKDYRNVDNLLIPFKQIVKDNQVLISELEIQSVTLNQSVDNSIFN